MCSCLLHHFSHIWLFSTLGTVACQAPLSMAWILEWVAMPSSRGSFSPRAPTHVSSSFCTAGRVYTTEQLGSHEQYQFSSVQLLSHVWLFVTPWTAVHQASLSITNSQSLLKHMSIESVMSSNHLIFCHPLLLPPSIFPSIKVFPVSQLLALGDQLSASASVLPMNIQDWFLLGQIGWISLQSKGLSRVFSKSTVQKHQFFGAQLSL